MAISQWIDEALATAQGDGCLVLLEQSEELNLRWATNALTTNGQMSSCQASVIAVRGKAAGQASGPVASAADLVALVAGAQRAAADAPDSDDAAELVDGDRDPDFDEPAQTVDVAAFSRLTQELGEAMATAREEGHLLFGFAELTVTTQWLGSTTGLRRRHVQPRGRLELTAKAPDMVNSAWVGQSTNDFTDVDIHAHHAELRKRLAWGEKRVELPAGRYETLLPPGAVVDLFYPMTWDLALRDAVEGRSAFSGKGERTTRIGEKLSDLPLRMSSDPRAEGIEVAPFALVPVAQPGSASVFDNGMPTERVDWIADGHLRELMATRAIMRREGVDGPLRLLSDNLVIDAEGTASLDEMIARTERGLLLTCLWYIRTVDPQTLLLTGLTRDGVYLIEDGKVVAAVNNFRYNESPLDLMRRATEASRAERTLCREWNDWFTLSVAPALRIPDFQMSTVSQAH